MAEHGGYRKPKKPAPVSGPGRLSRRTDGGPSQNVVRLPNAGYGESAQFEEAQSGASMEAATPVASAPSAGPPPAADNALASLLGGGAPDAGVSAPAPLTAGTQMPDQPITAGAPIGPGPGMAPEVMAPVAGRISDTLERLTGGDLTGEIADMYADLRSRGL